MLFNITTTLTVFKSDPISLMSCFCSWATKGMQLNSLFYRGCTIVYMAFAMDTDTMDTCS